MANNLSSNTSDLVIRTFLDAFTCDQVLTKTVDTQLITGEINPRTGDRVRIKRPHQYRSKRTVDGDISQLTRNDIISGSAFAEVQDYITVDIEYGQLEEAIELDQLDQIIKPAAKQMIADLEVSLARYMNEQSALQLGTAGTALTKWSDVAQTGSMLDSLGVPQDEWYAVMSPFNIQSLADAQGQLSSGSNNLVDTAWERAQISTNFGGIRAISSNCLTQHTNGAHAGTITVSATPTATYASVKDTYIRTIILAGFTPSTGGLLAGDVLEFDDNSRNFINIKSREAFSGPGGVPVKFTAVVTADAVADGGGLVTALITAPIFETEGQYNNISSPITSGDAVTVISGAANSTQNPNLFYHKQAFGLGTVVLPKLHATESSVISEGGFSIRMTKDSSVLENKQIVRFDLLPTFATFNPLFAGRFYGNP